MLSAAVEEVLWNRDALQASLDQTEGHLAHIDAFFRSTPTALANLPADSARALLRGLMAVTDFTPAHEASTRLAQAPALDSHGIRARDHVARWVRAADLVEGTVARTLARQEAVTSELSRYGAQHRSAGLSFLPAMVMRSGPATLGAVWADERLAVAIIDKATYQRVVGLRLELAIGQLDSLDAALTSALAR